MEKSGMCLLQVEILVGCLKGPIQGVFFMQRPRSYFNENFREFDTSLKEISWKKAIFEKDDTIAMGEELFANYYYLNVGIGKFYIMHENGGKRVLSCHGEGTVFPLWQSELSFSTHSCCYLQVTRHTEAYFISRKRMDEFIRGNSDFYIKMLEYYASFSNYLVYRSLSDIHDDAFTRVCNYLYLSNDGKPFYQKDNIIYLNQTEIAENAGVTRVQVARTLRKLRDEGIVNTLRNRVVILDNKRLLDHCTSLFEEHGRMPESKRGKGKAKYNSTPSLCSASPLI
jgi:CRP-like cAMP-binding protein